jgi:hypothetical protein
MKSNRELKVLAVLRELGLSEEHVSIVSSQNPSQNAPYHNSGHLFTVALNCAQAADYYELGKDEKITLFLSGLYHDYGHSAGKQSDIINISQAVLCAMRNISVLEAMSNKALDVIADNIHATVQPSLLHGTELSLQQKIIADADMMQWCEADADEFMVGLSVELGFPVTWDSTKEFLSKYNPKTSWGRAKLDALITTINSCPVG